MTLSYGVISALSIDQASIVRATVSGDCSVRTSHENTR